VNNSIHFDMDLEKMENDIIFCSAVLYFESVVFCRFKGNFKVK
jgi:hypothetical protein